MIEREVAKIVQIILSDNYTLQVNINGVCQLRIGQVEHVDLTIQNIKMELDKK